MGYPRGLSKSPRIEGLLTLDLFLAFHSIVASGQLSDHHLISVNFAASLSRHLATLNLN